MSCAHGTTSAHGTASPDAVCLSTDDEIFLRAMSMVGDVVRQDEWEYFIAHWPWAGGFDRSRVTALMHAGLLHPAAGGCFVPADVASDIAQRLPLGLHPLLMRMVGEALALTADSLERLSMGMRRLRTQSQDAVMLAASERWAETAAGIEGPRGASYVEAIGGHNLPPTMQAALRAAVPVLASEGIRHRWATWGFAVRWLRRSLRTLTVIRARVVLRAVWAVLLLGSCTAKPMRTEGAPVVERREPEWFTAATSTEGRLVAVAARDAGSIQRAMGAAEEDARTRLVALLRAQLQAQSEGMAAEAAPARRNEVRRALRPIAQEVAQERGDAAVRREYLIALTSRGYRAYVLTEVSTAVASRALAARIAHSPALLSQVRGTAAYRALTTDTLPVTAPK